jgi:hypothetical protein
MLRTMSPIDPTPDIAGVLGAGASKPHLPDQRELVNVLNTGTD